MAEHSAQEEQGSRGASFPLTRWSLVGRARGAADGETRRQLNELFTLYWSPLHAFLRRKGYSREDAQDLTQDFLADLMRRDVLAGIDPAKGKFRSFLLASLTHFLLNDRARKARLKRGGGHRFHALLADEAEKRYQAHPASGLDPERTFTREWARTLMDRARDSLRAAVAAKGQERAFADLWPCIAAEESAPPLAEVARRLGKGEGAVRVLVHRLRARYRDLLRLEIARTVATPEEVEEEIADLFGAVQGP
jgi:RNA polymerase sigma-70 factor (ECF subfamily)